MDRKSPQPVPNPNAFERSLRRAEIAVTANIEADKVVLDMRTFADREN
jgi:hypothetical protein